MNKKLILTAMILSTLCINSYASPTIRRNNTGRINRSANTVNVGGTITAINASVEDTTTVSEYSLTNPAPITDQIAKRNCTKMVNNAMDIYCKSSNNKCTNATQIYANLTYKTLRDENTQKEIANEVYCANFLESAIEDLLPSYNSKNLMEEENCNIALAKSFAAEDCYLYVMTNQSSQVIIKESDLKARCGIEGIQKQYKNLTKTNAPTTEAINDDLALYFSKVGNIGFSDLLAYPARVIDLKIDFKTSAFPRELVQLVNTIKSQGNVMCGPERYSELYDTNMPLEIKQTSWQKARDEKGLLKGTGDWIADQTSAFIGTNKTEEYKATGMQNIGKNARLDKCEEEYNETFDAETRASHTNKYKEEWIKDCEKGLQASNDDNTESDTETTETEATETTSDE